MIRRTIGALSAFWLLTVALGEPLLSRPTLVSTEWLASHLNDPRLRIVDARPALFAYLQGHIPGAVYLHTETLRISRGGVPAQLLSPQRLAEILGAIGIGNEHTVVIYSSGAEGDFFAHATYVAFVLESLGHRAIGILDGGFEKWQAENRPITQQVPRIANGAFQAPPQSRTLQLDAQNSFGRGIQQKSLQVLDARSPQVFANGHIPSARNAFLRDNLQGDKALTWRDKTELLNRLQQMGIDPNRSRSRCLLHQRARSQPTLVHSPLCAGTAPGANLSGFVDRLDSPSDAHRVNRHGRDSKIKLGVVAEWSDERVGAACAGGRPERLRDAGLPL
jgi:thiosulfate/3-mercaptopyruvate sulfurtransferase